MPTGSSWAVQQLAGLLAAISRYDDVEQMLAGATHRIAEAVDAEVCAIVSGDGEVRAAIGFPADVLPVAELLDVVEAGGGPLAVAGIGQLPSRVVELEPGSGDRIVLARSSTPLDAGELHLVRSMAQVMELALQLRRTADRERELRQRSEQQAAELQDANAALREASSAKDTIISVASHELRTPLTSILGFTATLRNHDDRLTADARREFLDVIDRHGQRLLRLVDDLLTVGRLESGRSDPDPQPVRLLAATEDLLAETHREPVAEGDPTCRAMVDADHLDQMLLNLLTNAEKYGTPPINVEVSRHGAECRLTVVDHGPGVPESFVPEMFDSFSQASTGESREASGTGLGLSIVAGLAAANGGRATYDHVEGCTRFAIHLPAADQA